MLAKYLEKYLSLPPPTHVKCSARVVVVSVSFPDPQGKTLVSLPKAQLHQKSSPTVPADRSSDLPMTSLRAFITSYPSLCTLRPCSFLNSLGGSVALAPTVLLKLQLF